MEDGREQQLDPTVKVWHRHCIVHGKSSGRRFEEPLRCVINFAICAIGQRKEYTAFERQPSRLVFPGPPVYDKHIRVELPCDGSRLEERRDDGCNAKRAQVACRSLAPHPYAGVRIRRYTSSPDFVGRTLRIIRGWRRRRRR